MKRTPLRRKTPLRTRALMRRSWRDRAGGGAAPGAELAGRLNGPVGAPREPAKPRSKYRGRLRFTDYMLWVKRQPCLMRGVWGTCEGPVEADHAGPRGVGRKAHDSTCIPLCHYHHHASRFPRSWPQPQRRAWLYAAIVYTQACARAAGIPVPADPEPAAEYPVTSLAFASLALAAIDSPGDAGAGAAPA